MTTKTARSSLGRYKASWWSAAVIGGAIALAIGNFAAPIGNPLSDISRRYCGKICDGAVVCRRGHVYYRNETPP